MTITPEVERAVRRAFQTLMADAQAAGCTRAEAFAVARRTLARRFWDQGVEATVRRCLRERRGGSKEEPVLLAPQRK